jgi:aspartate 1-decarboxylase
MLIEVLSSKIRYAKITHTELYYEGSITIDENWIDESNLRVNQKVQIVNLSNGERIETYVIKGERGSNVIGLNGPAARKGMVGDFVHIIAYGYVNDGDAAPEPTILDLKEGK